jgi:hypothetical protein
MSRNCRIWQAFSASGIRILEYSRGDTQERGIRENMDDQYPSTRKSGVRQSQIATSRRQ